MNLKQAIIVNKELDMGKGKACAQVAHASIQAFLEAKESIRDEWLSQGSKKIVLKATEEELLNIYKEARSYGIAASLIRDAGLTQIKPGSLTAVAVGPAEEGEIDKLVKELKLF
ncbi:MAG: peptidyl-tRNA hydrolase [Methanobacteriota archaeon]|nr:MAG: peptidyl-tRNA hydrolase [Euryarchaeota archaeon]